MKINGLKIRPATMIGGGVTQMKSLAELGLKAPQHLEKMVTRLWTANYGPSFSNLIDKYAKTMNFETDEDYTWKLQGSTYQNIPLIEARNSDGTPVTGTGMVGANGEILQLVFEKNFFGDGTLVLGEHNELYPMRVLGDGFAEGSNWVINVVLMGNAYDGIPATDLQAGKRFSRSFAPVENELSRRVGNIVKSTPTEMRNGWTTIRKDLKFTGAADVQQRLCCTLPVQTLDENNRVIKKEVDTWFTYEEWLFYTEWRKEKNDAELWARDNRTTNGTYVDFGKSGNVIRMGNGIMAQMEPGQTIYYNDFDIDDFVESFQTIFENGNVPMSERKIVVVTGQRGKIQFSNAVNKTTSGFMRAGSGVINTSNTEIDAVALGLVKNSGNGQLTYTTAQYDRYIGPNGIEIEVVVDESFDDKVRFKQGGLNGKGVLQSYAYYVFDMGSSTEPNIYRCKLTNSQYSDYMRYMLGMRNPWGLDGKIISSDEDASSMHTMTTLGACILDPSRCLRYLPVGL